VLADTARQGFHRALQQWYQRCGRHNLPWRQTKDPYAIWVSEVMLQQTQVKTVLERFYTPFLQKFPNLQSLAAADLQEVLTLWQGLGYYSRAKNLHRAAQQMVAQGCNTLPAEVAALRQLPGIGQNTAHAVAAFAFHQPVPVLEANVKRVVARIFALKMPKDTMLWEGATQLLNPQAPFDYNQAMMDLGSTLCTPKAPRCTQCPAAEICQGKAMPEAYPQKKAKPQTPTRKAQIGVVRNAQGHYAIRPRKTRLLHGLWEFPQLESLPSGAKALGDVKRAYSHFKLHATIWRLSSEAVTLDPSWHWKSAAEIAALPLSRIEVKVLKLLEEATLF